MPVVLSINEGEEYINDNQSSFLKEDFSSEVEQELDFYEVSKYVNNPLNNSQECIKTKWLNFKFIRDYAYFKKKRILDVIIFNWNALLVI